MSNYEPETRKERRERSKAQNRALWGVAYPALISQLPPEQINAITIVPENWHEYFCGEYFGWVEIGFPGSGRSKPARTTTTDARGRRVVLTTTEFNAFYEFIQAECADKQSSDPSRGIQIPSPNEPMP